MICTNTMHRMAAEVEAAVEIPLIHVADATAAAIRATPLRHPLLLAAGYAMAQTSTRALDFALS